MSIQSCAVMAKNICYLNKFKIKCLLKDKKDAKIENRHLFKFVLQYKINFKIFSVNYFFHQHPVNLFYPLCQKVQEKTEKFRAAIKKVGFIKARRWHVGNKGKYLKNIKRGFEFKN